MGVDWRGLPLSGADAATAAAIACFQADFQAFRDEAAAILDVAEAAPECVTAQTYAAAMHVYSQAEADIRANTAPLIARARAAAAGASERERLVLAAVEAWARADFAAAAAGFEAVAARWPEDVTAVKFAEFVFFEAPDFPRHLAFMERVAAANDDLPCFLAMRAFAHELNGGVETAIGIAARAIAAEPDTPWAHHALAHAYLNNGRIDEGLAVLDRHAASWDGHSQGIRGHNVWHLALLHLAAMDVAPAMALYRTKIAGLTPESVFEHTDAIGFLWRLELAGVPVEPALWAPLADPARRRAGEAVMPFLNALYLHALVRAGDAAAARAAIEAVEARKAGAGEPWTSGLSVCRGVLALAEGDAARGIAAIEPALPAIGRIGGSDAQNDVLVLAFIAGLAAAGRPGDAAAAMRKRLAGRPATAFEAAVAAGRAR